MLLRQKKVFKKTNIQYIKNTYLIRNLTKQIESLLIRLKYNSNNSYLITTLLVL